MLKYLLTTLLALFALTTGRTQDAVTLLKPGETLTYNVGWGPIRHAGEIKIAAVSDVVDGQSQVLINTQTQTRGLARALLKFDGNAQTRFDVASGQLLSATASSVSKEKKTQVSMTLDYTNRETVKHLALTRGRSDGYDYGADSKPQLEPRCRRVSRGPRDVR
jgi:hypothetical protein